MKLSEIKPGHLYNTPHDGVVLVLDNSLYRNEGIGHFVKVDTKRVVRSGSVATGMLAVTSRQHMPLSYEPELETIMANREAILGAVTSGDREATRELTCGIGVSGGHNPTVMTPYRGERESDARAGAAITALRDAGLNASMPRSGFGNTLKILLDVEGAERVVNALN